MTTFTVAKCTANKNGGFVWKLQVITTANCFGVVKSMKRTYYIGGMPTAVALGHQIQEDMARFDVVEREFVDADGNKMMLKWLNVKVA